MRQYSAVKKEHPNALVFFRLGDFYELFFEDAVVAARELQITLTSRNREKGIAVPMCGVPYHAAENYIAKLIRKGFKVAICDQMEDPRLAKKLVRREVTRVVTPGTAADASLGSEENNFLAAISRLGETVGFAALDLSTGDFRATEFAGPDAERRVWEELQQLRPRELLYSSSAPLFDSETRSLKLETDSLAATPVDDWVFAPDHAIPLVENHFGVLSLEGFGLSDRSAAASAAGAILYYIRSTQRGALEHIDRIGYYERQSCLVLDAVTVRNLELIEPLFTSSGEVTLFRSLDATQTPMGKRLLRNWILRPSIDPREITLRLDAVEVQVKHTIAREELRRALEGILDIERLLSRMTLEAANARDLLALAASLRKIPNVKAVLRQLAGKGDVASDVSAGEQCDRLATLYNSLDELTDVRQRIEATITEEPPLTFADGGVIRAGVDAALDELRDLSRNSRRYVAEIEERERRRTGISSLKVKFNSVFGYHIEVTKPNLHLVPSDYERKQTLVNAERFTTPELKQYEAKILDAQEKIIELERRIFIELRASIAAQAKRIRQSALALAEIDVLACFAYLAATRAYCRPQLLEADSELEIVQGRHPVIEQQEAALGGTGRFVPNDLYLNSSSQNILILTGPNMGGKSTYLRQTALIVLIAQMGSFVPAQSARLSIVDRIFTRIGASDNLARGRSTFMVEMTETAAILNTSSERSLILLDEIGRGTATYDGLAIAWATVEHIHAHVRAKTLFATHYHELTELADRLAGVKNFHVSVKDSAAGIVFLRKVEPGAASRSYGIEVAKLAGLPSAVVARARQVLVEHESTEHQLSSHLAPANEPSAEKTAGEQKLQLTIFTPLSQKIVDQLRATDLDRVTPLEALNLLHALKKDLD
jgi:DNA mismatch repair protein MutS